MKVAVIGGGASGMVAAIRLSQGGCEVSIFEHMPRMGKKILVTGSGKCNISNTDMDIKHFHGGSEQVINAVLGSCTPEKTKSFFENLGLYYKDRNGYLYPYSEQASAVVDVLRFAIRDLGIEVYTDTDIRNIIKCDASESRENRESFMIETSGGRFYFDRVIVSCGSNVSRNTGSDGSGYAIAKSLGHTVIRPLPALTFLTCEEDFYPSVAGIRTKASVTMFAKKRNENAYELLSTEEGELQLTKTGISGIAVFNLSYLAIKSLDGGCTVKAVIDFLPGVSEEETRELIQKRIEAQPDRDAEEMFIGLFAKALGICICKRCCIELRTKCRDISGGDIDRLINRIKHFETYIKGYGDFEHAQVAQGGVSLDEVTNNLESRLAGGLYFTGEILDVNGDCGGYNLQWAASSAMCAAEHILGEES